MVRLYTQSTHRVKKNNFSGLSFANLAAAVGIALEQSLFHDRVILVEHRKSSHSVVGELFKGEWA